MVRVLVVCVVVCVAVLAACGSSSLATLDGSSMRTFDEQSSAFTVEAGDVVQVSWAVEPDAGLRDSWVKVSLLSTDGLTNEMVVLSSGDSDSGTQELTAKTGGSFVLAVTGRNYGWSVEASSL